MDNLIQWLQGLLFTPFVSLGENDINLFKVIAFLFIFGAFLIIARFLRHSLRKFFTQLKLEENARERLLWLIFLAVVFFGVVVGLATIGIDLTLLGAVLTVSIPLGDVQLNLAKFLSFFAVVIGAIILSKHIRQVLHNQVLPPFRLPINAQFLLLRLVHISILILGILIGLNITGLKLTSIAVVLGGLSIGIGFGLQNIASNLVSGVILIFESPIRVGDRVTVSDMYGSVRAINMRSTVVATDDNIEVIVPNSQFISESIINWTHSNKEIRIKIPVAVAYGSDTALVKQALLEVAKDHPQIIQTPQPHVPSVTAPLVRFVNFGASSLDFELLVWISDIPKQFDIASDLHFMIDDKFRKYDISIPFPQQDVYLHHKPIVHPEADKTPGAAGT